MIYAALVALGVLIGWALKSTRKTMVTYHPVDLRDRLARYGQEFVGLRLSGTTFEHVSYSQATGAHDAADSLIRLARSIYEEQSNDR